MMCRSSFDPTAINIGALVCHDGRQGRPKHKLSVRLKIEGNIEKKYLILIIQLNNKQYLKLLLLQHVY
jgi:hypothetical protein